MSITLRASVLCCVAMGVARPSVAAAVPATLTVNSTGDDVTAGDGYCTLREALGVVSGTASADCGLAGGVVTISFAITTPATITVASSLSLFSFGSGITGVIINGPGQDQLTISGGGTSNVFRVMTSVTFQNLTIANGKNPPSSSLYGGLTASGATTIDHVTFSGHNGGGVALYGPTTITNSTFIGNGPGWALMVYNGGPAVVIDRCSFLNNASGTQAGAVLLDNWTTVTISRSYFYGNTSVYDGGALTSGGKLTLTDDVFDHNHAGTSGGAVFFSGPSNVSYPLTVSRTTFSNNVAGVSGGGLYLNSIGGYAHLDDTTFFGNSAVQNGGGLYEYGAATDLVNVTIVGNSAAHGGGFAFDAGPLTLESCIVSGNTSATDPNGPSPDCYLLRSNAFPTSLGYNFFGSLARCAVTIATSDVTGAALLLDTALATNGNNVGAGANADQFAGTLLPAAGSPVINSGPTPCAGTATLDERQGARSLLACDAGAVETTCGDGTVQVGEDCDTAASLANTGACTLGCKNAACGDGFVWAGHEECDLGGANAATGACTTACKNAVCGDGFVWAGHEACDDGAANGATTCAYGQHSCSVCTASCTSAAGTPSYCGDSVVDAAHEQCDAGSANGTTACAYGQTSCSVCTAACNTAAGTTSVCGDSQLDAQHEQCDAGSANTLSCAYGQTSCTVCSPTCVSQAGITSYCGDGNIDAAAGELCDQGAGNGTSCLYGEVACSVCTPACVTAAGSTSYCGDSVVDAAHGEQCDVGAAATTACAYGQHSCTVCSAACAQQAGTTSYCGDGVADTANGEQCDPGSATTTACAYGQHSCTVCSAACAQQAGTTSYCGDGVADTANGEQCDLGDQNGALAAACDTSCRTITPIIEETSPTPKSGCGCQGTPGGASSLPLAALVVVLGWRRRRVMAQRA
jgi:uncharacterized protein (TIGR03382 family)